MILILTLANVAAQCLRAARPPEAALGFLDEFYSRYTHKAVNKMYRVIKPSVTVIVIVIIVRVILREIAIVIVTASQMAREHPHPQFQVDFGQIRFKHSV